MPELKKVDSLRFKKIKIALCIVPCQNENRYLLKKQFKAAVLLYKWKGGKTMNRIKSLNGYQKGILLLMIAMIIIFTVFYAKTISRVGFAYQGAILVPSQENGSTVYAGKIEGEQASFTVTQDQTVVFQYGDKTYGPYTVKKDSTALPKAEDLKEEAKLEDMVGVEILQGDSILFRGGIEKFGDHNLLYNEDGTLHSFGISFVINNGETRDADGNLIDPMEPDASTIWELINGPQLTHKGQWYTWFGAVVLCVLNGISILFADELFRWNMRFHIRDAENAEPSDWEMCSRYIAWTVIAIMTLALFIMGLQQ